MSECDKFTGPSPEEEIHELHHLVRGIEKETKEGVTYGLPGVTKAEETAGGGDVLQVLRELPKIKRKKIGITLGGSVSSDRGKKRER